MENKKTVFIHVGTHKTGSSALQKKLRESTDLLRKHGHYFVRDSRRFLVALQSISNDDSDSLEKERKNFRKVIDNTTCHRLILSEENFSGSMRQAYSEASHMAEKLHNMLDNHNIKIIAYLRRQDQFIESAYIQTIHEGETWSFKEFCSSIGVHRIDWYEYLSSYAKHFGKENIIVRPYEKEQLKDGNTVSDFFSILGIPLESSKREATEWKNRSYNRSALEIARLCNGFLDRDDRARLRRLLNTTNAKQPFEDTFLFSPREKQELLDYYEQSNLDVAKEFLGREQGRLFMQPMPSENGCWNEQRNSLSTEELAILIMNIFLAEDRSRRSITRTDIIYEIAFIGELQRLIVRLLNAQGRAKYLARALKHGINVSRRIQNR